MVSPNCECFSAYEIISGSKAETKDPTFCEISNNVALINPTEAFLKPENKHNFISMYYLLRTVEKAKFIFILNSSDLSEVSMITARKYLKRLYSLIKREKGNIQ